MSGAARSGTSIRMTAVAVTFSVMLPILLPSPTLCTAGESSRLHRSVHPNPFVEGVIVHFELFVPPPGSRIGINVYNIRGEHIRQLFPSDRSESVADHPPGNYDVPWDGRDKYGGYLVPGVYLCMLKADGVIIRTVKVVKLT